MATFSVNDQTRRVVASGAAEVSFSFQVNATSDVKVFVDGTQKTESTHYDIKTSADAAGLNTDGTGKVVFTTGNVPAGTTTVTILSDVPAARTSVYTAGGNITATSLEADFDTMTMLIGDREERDSRALLAPVDDPTTIDMTIPDKDTRAGKVLGFNSSTGNPEATQQVTGAAVNVSSLSTGSSPTASVTVSGGTATFALGIPTGATGATGATGSAGAAATISVGTVTTGSAGSSVTVTNSGSSSAATFDFSIPAGATGATGAQGPQGPQGPAGSGTGDLLASNNLSDVANAGTSRTNLGLGTIATQAANSVNIDGGAIDGVTIGTNSVVTDLRVDNLKLDGNAITSTDTNGTIDLTADGTGNVVVKGNTNPGTVVFNCESNSHGQTVKAQPHSASVTNTLTLPPGGDGELVSTVATQTLTNKTIGVGQLSGQVAIANGGTGATSLAGANIVTTNANHSFTAAQRGSTDTDTSNTGSVTLDFDTNQNFVLTLTGNVTLANPSTESVGQSGFIVFIQDGTGGRTVSLGTDYETAGGAGLTLSSAASTTDIVPYVVAASGRILLGAPQLAFA